MAGSKKLYHFNYALNKELIKETRDRLEKKAEMANEFNAPRIEHRYKEIDRVLSELPQPDAKGVVKVSWKDWQVLDSAARASR